MPERRAVARRVAWRSLLAALLGTSIAAGAAVAETPSPGKVAQHICAPLAERLYLAQATKPRAPGKDAASRARAAAAAEVSAWRYPQARMAWNALCALRPAQPAGAMRGRDTSATMLVRGDRLWIAGEIDGAFAARLRAKLDRAPGIATVSLLSPGGDIAQAIAAGALIRERGIATEAYGSCLSACPLVFLGGRSRTVILGAGRTLGFHQASWHDGTAVSAINPVQAQMGGHVSRMGAAPFAVLGWMRAASPEDMMFPARRDLCAAGVATRPTCPSIAVPKR